MNRRALLPFLLIASSLACHSHCPEEADHGHEHAAEAESWAVTAWGERYEVFAETDALVVGHAAASNAHVTILAGFAPLEKGAVSVVLRAADGREETFRQEQRKRSGIFPVEIKPTREGEFELFFAIEHAGDRERIAAGRVKVGSPAAPGGALGEEPGGDGLSFLKEQQWRTEFATVAAAAGSLRASVSGPARVRPARGGAVLLTASVDAVVDAEPWPYAGLPVPAGGPVFRLRPRATDRSLPELGAEATSLEAEVQVARQRVDRLQGLLAVEATSAAEVERARAALLALEARLAAARDGLAVAGGAGGAKLVSVLAPWAGLVAEVAVTPGQSVAAGTALGRLVRPRPLWLDVALRPDDARRLTRPAGLTLRRAGDAQPRVLAASAVRKIASAPELDPQTGALAVTLEVDLGASELPIGSAVEAEIALDEELPGLVLPASALIDDAGVSVVYVQDSGESFSRREVKVLAREGERVLLSGVKAGERAVTRGGAAVRRASLLSAGAPEGHVH